MSFGQFYDVLMETAISRCVSGHRSASWRDIWCCCWNCCFSVRSWWLAMRHSITSILFLYGLTTLKLSLLVQWECGATRINSCWEQTSGSNIHCFHDILLDIRLVYLASPYSSGSLWLRTLVLQENLGPFLHRFLCQYLPRYTASYMVLLVSNFSVKHYLSLLFPYCFLTRISLTFFSIQLLLGFLSYSSQTTIPWGTCIY